MSLLMLAIVIVSACGVSYADPRPNFEASASDLATSNRQQLNFDAIYSLLDDIDDISREHDSGSVRPDKPRKTKHCGAAEFSCKRGKAVQGGKCIDSLYRCDGNRDCRDNSDELRCTSYGCPYGLIKCADRRECIMEEWLCDGYLDCADRSDEIGCEEFECMPGWEKCANQQQCIESRYRCDAVIDCADGSDERNCEDFECREGFLKCNNGFQCYNATWRCDDKIFCSDGSDEKGCGVHSRWRSRQGVDRDYYLQSMVERSREGDTVAAEWSLCLSGVSTTCDDGRRCFLDFLRCDGQAACADGSDEHHCLNYTCPPEKVKCADLETCVFREYVCDGVRHCADGSDELSCGTPIRQEPRTSTTQRRRPATKRRQLAAPSPRGGGR